ncbi:MAG: hypothetical protein HY060_00595 [Proteobacteria bacterium]|nr:hypothetical protein [Pseudomonadota bacterium]
MRSLSALTLLALSILATGAGAQEQFVTNRDRVMCRTQQSLREALNAIDTKDRAAMHIVQGCRYSVEGVHAEVLQDSVSMIKIRIGPPDDPNRSEFWALPDTVKPAGRR